MFLFLPLVLKLFNKKDFERKRSMGCSAFPELLRCVRCKERWVMENQHVFGAVDSLKPWVVRGGLGPGAELWPTLIVLKT